MAKDPLSHIRARLSEMDVQLAALNAEADELRTAWRVLERINNADGSLEPTSMASRPTSIGEKAEEALCEKGPMGSRALWSELKLWRPDLTFETLSGTLARYKRAGRVSLTGKTWSAHRKRMEAPTSNGPLKPHEFRHEAEQTGAE